MLIEPIKTYTYKDYLTYDENERIEIIEGEIISISPAPSRIHQEIISEIDFKLKEYIKSNNGSCKVYPAPFDVILKNDDDELTSSKNIVQIKDDFCVDDNVYLNTIVDEDIRHYYECLKINA